MHVKMSTEWFFRSGLDRYVWIYGMLCAFLHPTAESLLKRLEEAEMHVQAAIKTCLLAGMARMEAHWAVVVKEGRLWEVKHCGGSKSLRGK